MEVSIIYNRGVNKDYTFFHLRVYRMNSSTYVFKSVHFLEGVTINRSTPPYQIANWLFRHKGAHLPFTLHNINGLFINMRWAMLTKSLYSRSYFKRLRYCLLLKMECIRQYLIFSYNILQGTQRLINIGSTLIQLHYVEPTLSQCWSKCVCRAGCFSENDKGFQSTASFVSSRLITYLCRFESGE